MSESLAEFLNKTSDDDRSFLGGDELHRIPETLCAMANSSGGWIVAGALYDEAGELIISGLPEHVSAYTLFASPEFDRHEVFDYPARVIAAHVKPLSRHEKPGTLNNKFYRRVEGVNVISGRFARSLFAREALDLSHDDFPVDDLSFNQKDIDEFRKSITQYKSLSLDEFLHRSFIYSGKHLTFAGALMFGDILRIRAELHHNEKIFALESHNIWQAYNDMMTRVTCRLSSSCSLAVRAAFVNSLLHSDYNLDNHINILITSGPPRIIINNPGIIRESDSIRNIRLNKIFQLAGISHGLHEGLRVIKNYQPDFRLEQDFAAFRVIAELRLEGREALPAPVML